MKKTLYLLPFVLLGCATSNTKSDKGTTATVSAYEVKQQDVAHTLQYLASDELEGRDSGSKGIEKAAIYLENLLRENNIKPYFKTYRDTLTNFHKPAFNIVGFIEGNDPKLKNEFVIIGAHYDHIGRVSTPVNGDDIANGANDNASGTTVMSEVAKYFAKNKTNKRSILVVFFSAEEKGLLGSYHLAKKLKEQHFNLYTMLNFEMLGVPMKREFSSYITGFGKSNMSEKINEYTQKKTVGFLEIELQYRLFMASDNYPFFVEFNVPAQTVCTFDFENYSYYHHPSDEFKLMDTAHMAAYAKEIIPAVAGMTNSKEKEIKLN
ncbi:M20/M25/M40 family metallo-hydrolase [Flavobacterium supellecticarium]|uniref:M20/M25/M40 family metallo-hydrolase n=1 Tax=Flavobacterium supellecticarium TaxID=2565924 RepID=A0A4S3ZXA2_9FLAO|nr:M28 family peptidase [Flavobacterium supellecticarium]THF50451.1 M20/M25/M40 family metallo-hydrolase [Flavobacterium supellecticarium]